MKYLSAICGLLSLLATLGAPMARADVPAVHGMLLFGNNATYASHLPMFHAPHDYQLILQLALVDAPRSETLAAYASAKAQGQKLFTLVPEVMDLTQLINGSKTSFKASIYSGHFERGGTRIGPVVVDVVKIVHAAKLDPGHDPSDLQQYIVFGSSGEYFAAHLIEGKPSFDALFQIAQPQQTLQSMCGRGFCPEPSEVPVLDAELPLALPFLGLSDLPTVGDLLGSPLRGVHAVVQQQQYLEVDELAQ